MGAERFDYIVCHGVYSWVPPTVRTAILRIACNNLADNGVATSATAGEVVSFRAVLAYLSSPRHRAMSLAKFGMQLAARPSRVT